MGDSKQGKVLKALLILWWLLALLAVANYVGSLLHGNQQKIVELNHLPGWLIVPFVATPAICIAWLVLSLRQNNEETFGEQQEAVVRLLSTHLWGAVVFWSMPPGFKAIDPSYDHSAFLFKFIISAAIMVFALPILLAIKKAVPAKSTTVNRG